MHIVRNGDGTAASPYRKPLGLTPSAGMVAVVAGAAGEFAPSSNNFKHVANVPLGNDGLHALQTMGSFLLDIDGDLLTGRFIDLHGSVLDEFFILKAA